MANKNDNKSMFLYTALIFIVAVLLIIFSFLGQTNMQKNQPQVIESPDKEMSISEKASILSEENTVLLENNSNLKKENQECWINVRLVQTYKGQPASEDRLSFASVI